MIKIISIQDFIEKFHNSQSIVFLTGAGISVASGIGTYRGAEGQFEKEFEGRSVSDIVRLSTLKKNPNLFWRYQKTRLPILKAKPNYGHYTLAYLEELSEKSKKNFTLITQNIDRLHQKAGSKKVIEVHGTLSSMRCVNPNCNVPFIDTLLYFNKYPNHEIATCEYCGSYLRPNILLFGEKYENKIIELLKQKIKFHTDLFICVGTSFKVMSPVSSFPRIFKSYNKMGYLIEINLHSTHVTKQFTDGFLEGSSNEIFKNILEQLKK